MGWSGRAPAPPAISWSGAPREGASDAFTSKTAVAVIGIDIGKNSFHVIGLDDRGSIVLRQKWSRPGGNTVCQHATVPDRYGGLRRCVAPLDQRERGYASHATLDQLPAYSAAPADRDRIDPFSVSAKTPLQLCEIVRSGRRERAALCSLEKLRWCSGSCRTSN
jgi:hypothetical protein